LPAKIEQLESKIATLHDAMAAPEFYKQPSDDIARATNQLRQLEKQLTQTYERWEDLEGRAG
jgi:ATP-binding cassette subfamily F protein uup